MTLKKDNQIRVYIKFLFNYFVSIAIKIAIKITISIVVATSIVGFIFSNAFALSISKEREIAVEFMEAIERQDKIIKDSMALALVSEIGEQIVKVLPPQPFKYSFYVVNEEQFNAFAGPGSNIFVHRGLITSLDNVDELAGIIGHEIAHSSCRHISEMVDQSKIMTIGTLAGVLAGVLLGAAGGSGGVRGGGDLGQAVLIGSVAATQTAMLSYSREHETEADQKGLVYLTKAGFDPNGLLTGLKKIRSRDWFGSEIIPDYLKTHPGSTERIVQIQSWIEGRGKNEVLNGKTQAANQKNSTKIGIDKAGGTIDSNKSTIDPFRFEMVKYRLTALYGDEDEAQKLFNSILQKEPDSTSANYGMALLMERKSRFDESMKHLRKALDSRAFDPNILLEMGKINTLLGKPQKAVEIMQGLEFIPEVKVEALFYLSEAKLMAGMVDSAEKGFEQVIAKSPQFFPKAYYHLAAINGDGINRDGELRVSGGYNNDGKVDKSRYSQDRIDRAGVSHYYLGLYYYEIKNIKSAKTHLLKSLETLSDDDKKKHAQVMLMKIEMRELDAKMESRRRRR
ncbi:MAG: M48 family metalloprotease [Desulfamplus sp.]|nr:M48 family metalloprotease [Desulfamplus sp.]